MSRRDLDIMTDSIRVINACENNLKNVNVDIPYYKHTVIAGVSGSGKSTLAYDVIYATAQRKLLDCMSDQDKVFSTKMKKPVVDNIEGLSTVISLKQVRPNNNPRSTISSYTSIGSCMRNLMAMHGRCRCLYCEHISEQTSIYSLINDIENIAPGTIVEVGFPYFFNNRSEREQQLDYLRRKGYRFIYINGIRTNLRDRVETAYSQELIIVMESRFQVNGKLKKSDINCLKDASRNGDKYISIYLSGEDKLSINDFYAKHGCPDHHLITVSLEASDFSYNDMAGSCTECLGSGTRKIVHPSKVVQHPEKSLREGPFFKEVYSMNHPYSFMSLYSLSCHYGFSFDEPYETLPQHVRDLIMYGTGNDEFVLQRPEGYNKVLPGYLSVEGQKIRFKGILSRIEELYQELLNRPETPSAAQENFFKTYMHETDCPYCNGTRLKKIRNYTFLNGRNYAQLGRMELSDLSDFIDTLVGNEMSQPVMDMLKERLELLKEIGVGYLSFDRRIDTLSGGEYQRLRLANQIGSGLVGLTYIIDEPTDGLHGSDNQRVIKVINRLLEKRNTVITIEHDLDIIKAADYIIEMGSEAGINGGEVIAAGTLDELQNNPYSIIGKRINTRTDAGLKNEICGLEPSIRIKGIEVNNVHDLDIEIPLYKITCFTGVSGSGKSSVVYEVLYKALCQTLRDSRILPGKYNSIDGIEEIDNVICIDQSILNGKNTSIPATYLGIFDTIRTIFSQCVNDEHEMKDNKSYFSFNSRGACPVCKGKGHIDKYIQYFGETKIMCAECKGQQYRDEVLLIKYNGKNIKQVLDMTFTDGLEFFEQHAAIYMKIKLMCDLGLGYLQLGQPLNTLSGGEAQRLKLAKEMTKYNNRKNQLYIFDEPTVGLSSKDIDRIIAVMREIISNNNTVVLVEHDPDMILCSDYIIDMGPDAGKNGGKIMFCGTPYQMLHTSHSKTADYLRKYLNTDDDI